MGFRARYAYKNAVGGFYLRTEVEKNVEIETGPEPRSGNVDINTFLEEGLTEWITEAE